MVKLKITSPELFQLVDHETVVCGKVTPASGDVQVYILAADGQWYLQKPVEKHGNKWSVTCHFGFEDPSGAMYAVVAVATSERPTTPLVDLPEGVEKSDTVLVIRK